MRARIGSKGQVELPAMLLYQSNDGLAGAQLHFPGK